MKDSDLIDSSNPPKLADAKLTPSMSKLVETAKKLYVDKLAYFAQLHKPPAFIACAPGRVNLIGEHTDYNNGFVLPMAIDYATVVYGTGFIHTGKGTGATTIRLRMISDKEGTNNIVEERKLSVGALDPPDESAPRSWANYVVGTIVQYMPDLPCEGCSLDLAMAFASDVPSGAGLSSSAALEVATATFLECFMHDMAFSAAEVGHQPKVERAIRCQQAENDWAFSPCGIMDQYASSAAKADHAMLIDCQSLEVKLVPLKQDRDRPVFLITNSMVSHEIADSEYGKRRHECQDALDAMQQVPLYHVLSLRDANMKDCDDAKDKMGDEIYGRAKHVVTENKRTLECKTALKLGVWDRVGELMNASHESLRDDYAVSCQEVDYLVASAQKFEGVYGSRITGGGFGGCTITLVDKTKVDELIEHLKAGYKETYEKDCECFVTNAAEGSRVLAVDMDCKHE